MSPSIGCALVLVPSLTLILGLVLGFGFHEFLVRRIEAWLPPGIDND